MNNREKVTRIAPHPKIKGHWEVFGPEMKVIGVVCDSMLDAKCIADAIEAAYDAGYKKAREEMS